MVTIRAAFIVILGFLFILAGCANAESTTTPEPESTKATIGTTSISGTNTTESKNISDTEPTQTEKPVETSPVEETTPESTHSQNTDDEAGEPILLDTLRRNCQFSQGNGGFNNTGLAVGETAVNLALKDTNGNEFRLSRLLAEKPVVMVFGSFT